LDKESGYYFYNARHYDPEIARFVTPDTVVDGQLDTQGWNRYMYCRGNPIRYNDPTGHDWRDNILNTASSIGEKISSVGEGIKSAGEKLTKPLSEMGEKFRDSISPKVDRVANWCNKNPGKMLGIGLGGGLAIAAAPAAPLAVAAVKSIGAAKGIDMAFGTVQGLLTYGATTPANEQTLKGAAISTGVGAATGLVSNVTTGLKMIDKAPSVIKALSSGAISGGGNFAGQVVSGKEVKDVSAASVGWAAATSGFASYLGSATNLAKPASDLVGKGAMLVPRVSGAAMINMAEKQMKKD
jgi:RHS repeat-associated protein